MGSTASTTYQDLIEGKLMIAVGTGTTTNVTVKVKQINGVTPTWPTAAHRLHVIQRTATTNKAEVWGVAAGTTQSGQTVTLGTLTRAIPLSDGTDFTGSGTAQSFYAGADVFLAWDAHDAAQSVKKDIANTFTADQTFNQGIAMSGTTKTLQVAQMTTTQRDAIVSPANGMIIYNTTTSVMNQYIGGAWTTFATGTVSNAANNVAGKTDIATAAEVAAGTAIDAISGAINVIPVSITKPTSTGAVSGSVVALNTSVVVDSTLLGSGSASSANYLLGNNTWGTIYVPSIYGLGTSGVPTWTSGATLPTSAEYQYTTATVPVSQTLTASGVNVPLIIHNTSDVIINGTVDMNGLGGAGGNGGNTAGNGSTGTAGHAFLSFTGPGAGTGAVYGANSGSGGGGGGSTLTAGSDGIQGAGTKGSGGAVMSSLLLAFLASVMRTGSCGAGGGGGSGTNLAAGGAGGAGGGCLFWYIGGNLTLGSSSIIRANGVAGTNKAASPGGGGGGGGNIVIIVAGTITDGGVTLSATGGAGGVDSGNASNGGAGAAGKAIIYSLSTGTLITA